MSDSNETESDASQLEEIERRLTADRLYIEHGEAPWNINYKHVYWLVTTLRRYMAQSQEHEAFALANSLKWEDGWRQIELKREWSYGNPETAHPIWTCDVGRFDDRGWIGDTRTCKTLAYGWAEDDNPAEAMKLAIQQAKENDTGEDAHPRDGVPVIQPDQTDDRDLPF